MPPAVIGGSTFVEHVEELSTMDEVDHNETRTVADMNDNAQTSFNAVKESSAEKESTQQTEPIAPQAVNASIQNETTLEVEVGNNKQNEMTHQQESSMK